MGIMDTSCFPLEIVMVFGEVLNISYPKQGCTSDVAVVEGSKGKYVVKRSYGAKYCKWLEQEYKVLTELSRTQLIVPKPHQFIRTEKHGLLECWLVMDFLMGDTLRSVLERTNQEDKRRRLLYSFGKVLSEVHSVAPCAEMLEEAEYYLSHYEVEGTPELLEYLRSNQPEPVQSTLIHGDFTIDNVLVQGDAITGIIDWSGGAYGDPRYDIALAIRPKEYCFTTEEDVKAFFNGYGSEPLSREEYEYFNGIYEFF